MKVNTKYCKANTKITELRIIEIYVHTNKIEYKYTKFYYYKNCIDCLISFANTYNILRVLTILIVCAKANSYDLMV